MHGELTPKSRSSRHLLDQAIQGDAQIAILQRLWTERSYRPSRFAETLARQFAGTTIVFLAFSRGAIVKGELGRFQLDDYACESLKEEQPAELGAELSGREVQLLDIGHRCLIGMGMIGPSVVVARSALVMANKVG